MENITYGQDCVLGMPRTDTGLVAVTINVGESAWLPGTSKRVAVGPGVMLYRIGSESVELVDSPPNTRPVRANRMLAR